MALINELAADPAPDEMLLVLDDYHLVDSGPVHESVALLLENLPPGRAWRRQPHRGRRPGPPARPDPLTPPSSLPDTTFG